METITLGFIVLGLGIVFLLFELFIPTGGILFILGMLTLFMGVVLVFASGNTYAGYITLFSVFILLPFLGLFLFWLWPRLPIGSKILVPPDSSETIAAIPGVAGLEQYKGRIGRAVSSLRPSGIVDFDGKRVDAITEGMLVSEKEWVKCIAIRSGYVIVRPVEQPNLEQLEQNDFM